MSPKAKYVHEGRAIDYTPNSKVEMGDVVVLEDLVGIAERTIEANQLGALAVQGVFELPKDDGSGTDIDKGADLWWNAIDGQVEKTEGDPARPYLGKAVSDAATDDETVQVRLSQ